MLEECESLGVDKAHLAPPGMLIDSAVNAGFASQELGILFEKLSPRKA